MSVYTSLLFAALLASVTVLGPTQPRLLKQDASYTKTQSPNRFPILTPGLVLGRANPKQIKVGVILGRPICVVGADNSSLRWLRVNAKTIQSIGALCYVVNIRQEADMAVLSGAAKVNMVATSGQVLVLAGLRGYPALILHTGAVK